MEVFKWCDANENSLIVKLLLLSECPIYTGFVYKTSEAFRWKEHTKSSVCEHLMGSACWKSTESVNLISTWKRHWCVLLKCDGERATVIRVKYCVCTVSEMTLCSVPAGVVRSGPVATSLSGWGDFGSCTVAPRYQQGPLFNREAGVRKPCGRWTVIYTPVLSYIPVLLCSLVSVCCLDVFGVLYDTLFGKENSVEWFTEFTTISAHYLFYKSALNWSNVTYKKDIYHGLHRNMKQHNWVQHW